MTSTVPASTAASVINPTGQFQHSRVAVTGSSALGFNRGTVYYPNEANTYGAIAVIPGFVSPESFVAWTGPYLASNGFMVMTLEPFSGFDNPESPRVACHPAQRRPQLAQGSSPSAIRSRIDPNRLGAIGHSMAGGATLELARATRRRASRPSCRCSRGS